MFDWLSYVDQFVPAQSSDSTAHSGSGRLACPSIDSIFLRAWGDVVCWDDAGSDHVLQHWDPNTNYADVFLDGSYQDIRRKHARGEMALPDLCKNCMLLRIQPAGSGNWDRSFVRILRVEPSYLCSLDCPGCVPLETRRGHKQAFQLDPEILDKIIADLTARGLDIDGVDFQGHGEPLLNPRLWEMGRRSRERLPPAWLSVTTNAQGRYRPEMSESGFDEIICSIDGMNQATYAPYRIHGHFDLGWKFMCELAEAGRRSDHPLRVVWKYVLFEHNSSPEMLLEAQKMALDAGVSELVFILTRNGPAPRHILHPLDIPRIAEPLAVSFRFHSASAEDLELRLAEANRLASMGNINDATLMAESIGRNLVRFFPDMAAAPERERRLMESVERVRTAGW